jgi:hypothetical protein
MAVAVKKTVVVVSPTTEKGESKVNATTAKKAVRVSRKAAPKEAATKKKVVTVKKKAAAPTAPKSSVPAKVTTAKATAGKRSLSVKNAAKASTTTFTPYRFLRSLIASGVDREYVVFYFDEDGAVIDVDSEFIKFSCVFPDSSQKHVTVTEIDDNGEVVATWYDDDDREDAVQITIERFIRLHNAAESNSVKEAAETEVKAQEEKVASRPVASKPKPRSKTVTPKKTSTPKV